MRLRKDVEQMDKDLERAFDKVQNDMNTVMRTIQLLNGRVDRAVKLLTSLAKDQKRFTKVGPVTGKTYTTLNGRVHAIAEHLGLSFVAKPKEVIINKAKIDIVKATKKGKK